MKDILIKGKQMLQTIVDEANKNGLDLPEELKAKMREGELGRQIKVESKLSLREKQKAKKAYEEREDQEFYEKTGIKDTSKDYNLDNLIKKYEYDMNREEKKQAKMNALDKQRIDYDPDEISVSEEEEEKDFLDKMGDERL